MVEEQDPFEGAVRFVHRFGGAGPDGDGTVELHRVGAPVVELVVVLHAVGHEPPRRQALAAPRVDGSNTEIRRGRHNTGFTLSALRHFSIRVEFYPRATGAVKGSVP
ncbi:MAG: hypothetical protein R2755_28220 [Acidimicrobiales bacterium]